MKEQILQIAYSLEKGMIDEKTAKTELLNLFSVSNNEVELCRCLDYEGTAEDGTCYYCRKKLRDDYPA